MDVAIDMSQGRPRYDLAHDLRVERIAFAAKVRSARAILGLSQDQFARRIGLTQKSVHRIEQGTVEPKLQTILKIQRFWTEQGIAFEDLRSGGFRLAVDTAALDLPQGGSTWRLRWDRTVEGLAQLSGDRRFAFDSYRRFITMYSNVVLGLSHDDFEEVLDQHKDRLGVTVDTELSAGDGFEMFNRIGIKAIICCPLVKQGRLVAMMAVHQRHPRAWTEGEVALVKAVVERNKAKAASAVVLAVDGSVPGALVPGLELPEYGRIAPARRTTCTYFAAEGPSPGKGDQLLRLNAGTGALAHNVAFPSDVSPAYAPAGQSLISVSTHGEHGLGETELTGRLQAELVAWFGPQVREWRHLRTYDITQALPEYKAGAPVQQPLKLAEGLYRCGDWASYPSLNAALGTGRQVAELLV